MADLPEPIVEMLRDIGAVGGESTYLVGGFVRDLLLDRPSLDIDIVIEGDAIRVARAVAERWRGKVTTHPKFGTATVTPADLHLPKVDFVTARRETYKAAGTLPIVAPGTITADLQRRDFSVNALAMRLGSTAFGEIVDATGGLEDLAHGRLRVLHDQSYRDDPTRIFRACRYAVRYGFCIADTDTALMRKARPVLRDLSGERLRNEIDRVLLEESAPEIVTRLTALGVWETIAGGWHISDTFGADFQKAEEAIAWAAKHLGGPAFQPQRVRWLAFFGTGAPAYRIEALAFRLALPHQRQRLVSGAQARKQGVTLENVSVETFAKLGILLSEDAVIEQDRRGWCVVDTENRATYISGDGNIYRVETPLTAYKRLAESLASVEEKAKPSEIYRLLKPYPVEALILGAVGADRPQWETEKIRDYLLRLRHINPFITGKDLIALGETPDTAFETRLWELFAAQLDGDITNTEEAYSRLRNRKNA